MFSIFVVLYNNFWLFIFRIIFKLLISIIISLGIIFFKYFLSIFMIYLFFSSNTRSNTAYIDTIVVRIKNKFFNFLRLKRIKHIFFVLIKHIFENNSFFSCITNRWLIVQYWLFWLFFYFIFYFFLIAKVYVNWKWLYFIKFFNFILFILIFHFT